MIQTLTALSIVENTYFGKKHRKNARRAKKPDFRDLEAGADSKRFDLINQRGRIAMRHAEHR